MRLVVDTNVLVAAFVARGQCHELLEHAARAHRVFVSEAILTELRRTLVVKLRVPDDLLALGWYEGGAIIPPAGFWKVEAERERQP